jgi:ABC-type Fe3+ transport system permease subunit
MSSLRRHLNAAELGTLFLWGVLFLLVGMPTVQVIKRVWGMPRPDAVIERVEPFRDWSGVIAAGQTVLWCTLIGVGAAGLALVWAWWMRGLGRRGRLWAMGVGLTPLLLPSYLAYAGWNLLRSPGSWLGDALAVAPPWASVWAWRGMAIGGLTLWVWPLALLVLAPAAMRVSQGALDAMKTDGASAGVRAGQVLRMLRGDLVRAVALCGLIMAGSAVPLHVAQVNTYTIWLWSEMNRVPDTRGVWIAALPMLVLAVAGAMFVLQLVPAGPRDAGEVDPSELARPSGRGGAAGPMLTGAACMVWAVSVVVPLLLFVLSVREPAAYPGFWREAGGGVASGLQVGAWVGGLGAIVLLVVWMVVANGATAEQRGGIGPPILWFTVAGLVPGVLVGTAFAQAWTAADSPGIGLVVVTHLARFVFIAALVGWWLGASEPAELRGLRELDGAATVRGWLEACVRPRWGVVAGTGVALCLLSLHEIESTVQVQPPGLDNLAQYLLDQLHYLRQDQLAAAGATMTGIGLVGAVIGGVLLARQGDQGCGGDTR